MSSPGPRPPQVTVTVRAAVVADAWQIMALVNELAMTRRLDAKASPSKFFAKPQRAIPLPQRTPQFTPPVLDKPAKG